MKKSLKEMKHESETLSRNQKNRVIKRDVKETKSLKMKICISSYGSRKFIWTRHQIKRKQVM